MFVCLFLSGAQHQINLRKTSPLSFGPVHPSSPQSSTAAVQWLNVCGKIQEIPQSFW
jgi:hypothetical protein